MDIATTAPQWANDILVWVGFGTVVGLLAKAIMPGRDPGGPVATLAMGIVGSVIGCGTLTFFYQGARVTPISPVGFIVATAGAFILLLFNRLFRGRLIHDDSRLVVAERPIRRSRGRRYADTLIEERVP